MSIFRFRDYPRLFLPSSMFTNVYECNSLSLNAAVTEYLQSSLVSLKASTGKCLLAITDCFLPF